MHSRLNFWHGTSNGRLWLLRWLFLPGLSQWLKIAQHSLIDIIISNQIFCCFFQTLCESMNLLKSQSIGCSLLSSVGAQKRNEAQRCIYATWPSTDMTFVNPTELFQLLSSRLDNTKPQQQRELLLLGRLRIEPLFSKCRIFHAEFLRDAWLNTFRRGMQ